jgi:hypothetical protein
MIDVLLWLIQSEVTLPVPNGMFQQYVLLWHLDSGSSDSDEVFKF